MFRNREYKIYLIISGIAVAAGAAGIVLNQGKAMQYYLFTAVLLIGSSTAFAGYRYYKISRLSDNLKALSSGDYSFDLKEYQEGELSILGSELYKVTLMLREQAELLKMDKSYLTDAISDISHQIKTPLTSMMVMSELLGRGELPEEKRKEFTEKLRQQIERLEWLVATLLKMSKLDSGAVILKKETVNIADMIKSAVAHLIIPMELKSQSLLLEGEETASFIGDKKWMGEAVSNIVKNCMEHTGEEGIIHIKYLDNVLYTQISIEDNGEGITKEELPHIFERFYKGKNSSADSAGIGLAFAQQIVRLQGGELSVQSKQGCGTQFTIKLYKRII